MVTASTPSRSATLTLTRSTSEVGQVLADEVRADRQLAVTAVDEHRQPHGGGPADVVQARRGPTGWCARRTGRRRRGPRPCRRSRRAGSRSASGCGPACSRRSSRYIVTSSEPTGTSNPSTAAIRSAIRRASGTPRVGMPSRTRSPAPLLRSRISWAMRVSARAMSRSSRTVRPSLDPVADVLSAGLAVMRAPTSFSASRDGSLKDVDRERPYSRPTTGGVSAHQTFSVGRRVLGGDGARARPPRRPVVPARVAHRVSPSRTSLPRPGPCPAETGASPLNLQRGSVRFCGAAVPLTQMLPVGWRPRMRRRGRSPRRKARRLPDRQRLAVKDAAGAAKRGERSEHP